MQQKILSSALSNLFRNYIMLNLVKSEYPLTIQSGNFVLSHGVTKSKVLVKSNKIKDVNDLQDWVNVWTIWLSNYG